MQIKSADTTRRRGGHGKYEDSTTMMRNKLAKVSLQYMKWYAKPMGPQEQPRTKRNSKNELKGQDETQSSEEECTSFFSSKISS